MGSSSSRFSLLIREEEFSPQRFFNSPTGPTELECAGRERVTRDCNTVLRQRDELNPLSGNHGCGGLHEMHQIHAVLLQFHFLGEFIGLCFYFWVLAGFFVFCFFFATLSRVVERWRVCPGYDFLTGLLRLWDVSVRCVLFRKQKSEFRALDMQWRSLIRVGCLQTTPAPTSRVQTSSRLIQTFCSRFYHIILALSLLSPEAELFVSGFCWRHFLLFENRLPPTLSEPPKTSLELPHKEVEEVNRVSGGG